MSSKLFLCATLHKITFVLHEYDDDDVVDVLSVDNLSLNCLCDAFFHLFHRERKFRNLLKCTSDNHWIFNPS